MKISWTPNSIKKSRRLILLSSECKENLEILRKKNCKVILDHAFEIKIENRVKNNKKTYTDHTNYLFDFENRVEFVEHM